MRLEVNSDEEKDYYGSICLVYGGNCIRICWKCGES